MNKSMLTYFSIGLVVLLVVVVVAAKYNATANPRTANNTTATQDDTSLAATEVQIEDITVGEGAEAQVGSSITAHYTGTLVNGTVFDSTAGKDPRTFTVAQGQLIDGWVEGIPGMREGGKRRLVVPAAKAYGSTGQGSIPPNADLIFEIELVSVN